METASEVPTPLLVAVSLSMAVVCHRTAGLALGAGRRPAGWHMCREDRILHAPRDEDSRRIRERVEALSRGDGSVPAHFAQLISDHDSAYASAMRGCWRNMHAACDQRKRSTSVAAAAKTRCNGNWVARFHGRLPVPCRCQWRSSATGHGSWLLTGNVGCM